MSRIYLAAALAIILQGCGAKAPAMIDAPGFSAVLLDNNQVYFGKVSGLGSDYPVLTEVFYIQTAVNPETKQQSSVLLKRGKEWHAPDRMTLNARHIVMIEPVTAGSQVAKLIEQAQKK